MTSQISDHLKGMCDTVVCMEPLLLAYIPNPFKTRKICDKAVGNDYFPMRFVPDWFVIQQRIKYGIITMTGIIIRLLSGTMIIKNERPKKRKLKS